VEKSASKYIGILNKIDGEKKEGNNLRLLQITFDLARQAREKGNHPFGALLADPSGHISLQWGRRGYHCAFCRRR